MSYYAFEGLIGGARTRLSISAVLIGDVIVGAGVYIGPTFSVVRGDCRCAALITGRI